MDELINVLQSGDYSLVVSNGDIRTYSGRGVSDLYRLLNEEPSVLAGSQVADKIVGKASAALMVLAKVKDVYAGVISEGALNLLSSAGVKTSYGTLVPYIINRAGTGLCPLEIRCMDCKSADECFLQITSFLNEMKSKYGNK